MRILFVEDEDEKAREVSCVLTASNSVEIRKSYASGVRALYNQKFDLILLDMSLPLYDSDSVDNEENEFETFAGIEIMNELIRLKRKEKVVIITAFDILGEDEKRMDIKQLDEKMKADYPLIYLGIIHYDASSLEWKRELMEIIKKHENTYC